MIDEPMTTHCTWLDKIGGTCKRDGVRPQTAKDGVVWARLCDEHEAALDGHMASGNPARVFGAWIAAQGGPKAAAGRI